MKQEKAPILTGSANASASNTVHNDESSKLMIFLPCHLSMLQALYDDQIQPSIQKTINDQEGKQQKKHSGNTASNIGNKNENDGPGGIVQNDKVEKHVWGLIHLFIKKRQHLSTCKMQADRMYGILEEVKLVSNTANKDVELGVKQQQQQQQPHPVKRNNQSMSVITATNRTPKRRRTAANAYIGSPNFSSPHPKNKKQISLSFTTQNQKQQKQTQTDSSSIMSISSIMMSPLQDSSFNDTFSPFTFHYPKGTTGGRRSSSSNSGLTSSHRLRSGGTAAAVRPELYGADDSNGQYGSNQNDDECINSLNLVRLLIEKRCATMTGGIEDKRISDDDGGKEQEEGQLPFVKLDRAVHDKIKELEDVLKSCRSGGGGSGGDDDGDEIRKKSANGNKSVVSWDTCFWDDERKDGIDHNGVDEGENKNEQIGRIMSKLWLWRLLGNSLKEIIILERK